MTIFCVLYDKDRDFCVIMLSSNLSLYDKICERVFFIYYLFEKCDVYKFLCSCLWPHYNLTKTFWLMILVESYYNLDILEYIWWAPIRKKNVTDMARCTNLSQNFDDLLSHHTLFDDLQYWVHKFDSRRSFSLHFPMLLD